jgi:hypothetical protein
MTIIDLFHDRNNQKLATSVWMSNVVYFDIEEWL